MSSRPARRLAIAAAVALGALLATSAPAAAASQSSAEQFLAAGVGRNYTGAVGGASYSQAEATCFDDPAGDVIALDDGAAVDEDRSDLLQHCAHLVQDAGTFTLSAEIAAPNDPTADNNWEGTVLGWFLDDDFDGGGEFFAQVTMSDGALIGAVQDRRDDPAVPVDCDTSAAYSEPFIVLELDIDCIDRPHQVRLSGGLIYDQRITTPSGEVVVDAAPSTEDFTDPVPGGGVEVVRLNLEDLDPIEIAIRMAQAVFPSEAGAFAGGGAPEVLLGRDDVFADSLASGGAQGTLNAPLLLTGTEGLDDRVADELERLGASTVTLLGGEVALSAQVEADLAAEGYTTRRLAGPTRLETAVEIASGVLPDATTAVLARAFGDVGGDPTQEFADSLAGGAYAAGLGIPVLLSQTEMLSDSTEAYLSESGITTVVLLGGTEALSEQVAADLTALGITVERLEGTNRFGTAVAVAQDLGYATAADADRVVLAEGQSEDAWVAGFTAALYTAVNDGALVLSNGDAVPPETATYISDSGVALTCLPLVATAACDTAEDLIETGAAG